LCEGFEVRCNFTIRRLSAIAVIAALVLAPLARPVMAGATPDAMMQAMADDMSASGMAADMDDAMPCCPSKAPAPIGCDKCAFMAACMSHCLTGMPLAVVMPFPIASDNFVPVWNEALADGMGHPPPEHPPRSLV
jgi:hypothetical protein